MSKTNNHLVWMAGVSWNDIHGTDWHMVSAMVCHASILWVDPPVSPIAAALRRNTPHQAFTPRISFVDEHITRLTPVAMPGLSRPGMRLTTAPLVRRQTKWALHRLGIRPFAVVATYPGDLLGYWGSDVVNVVYGTDDYVAGAELMGLSARYQLRQEKKIVGRADLVAAISPMIADRWASFGAHPIVIPNGCRLAESRPQVAPAELGGLTRPVVGLIGQLSDRIDMSILNALADSGFSLLIVGPLDPRWELQRFRRLVERPNVYYTGPVAAEAVPSYLAVIDVGITPYLDTPFNRASFPLKTLEYLGAGVPVVSTDIPAAQWLLADLAHGEHAHTADRIMALANDGDGFVDAVRRLAASDPAEEHLRAGQCIAFATRHTWERRAMSLASAIGLLTETSQLPLSGITF